MPIRSPIWDLSDEQFLEIVQSSKTVAEIAKKIGVASTGAIKTRLKTMQTSDVNHLLIPDRVAKYKTIPIDELKKIINESSTWKEIFSKLGYDRGSGSLNRLLKKHLIVNNINISHLACGQNWYLTDNGKQVMKNAKNNTTKPLSELLIDGSKISSSGLKKKIIE